MLASVEVMIGPLVGAALASIIGVAEALVVSGVLQLASAVFFFLLPNREQEMRMHIASSDAGTRIAAEKAADGA
jgi:hypothetical protein